MNNKKQWNRLLYFFLSIAVTAGVFSYLFTHVSIQDVLSLISNTDRRGVMMFVLLSLSMCFFRTWRYQLALRVSGYKPNQIALFLVVIVRNFFSDLLCLLN